MTRPDKRDVDTVERWCRDRDEHLRIEAGTNAITIGSVARLHYAPAEGTWTLEQLDGARPRAFEWAEPSPNLEPLLDVIDEDPTGVFWG